MPHALADAFGGIQGIDLADGEAEVADDAAAVGDDEGFGRSSALGLPGMTLQSVIERGFAAGECVQPMLGAERFRPAQTHSPVQGALRVKRSRRPSLGCPSCSSRSIKSLVLAARDHEGVEP